MALLAVQVHSNGQRQIRQVVVRSVGGCVKDVYEGDPEPLVLVVLTSNNGTPAVKKKFLVLTNSYMGA